MFPLSKCVTNRYVCWVCVLGMCVGDVCWGCVLGMCVGDVCLFGNGLQPVMKSRGPVLSPPGLGIIWFRNTRGPDCNVSSSGTASGPVQCRVRAQKIPSHNAEYKRHDVHNAKRLGSTLWPRASLDSSPFNPIVLNEE